MNHPSKETMQDFVDGELEKTQNNQVIEHISSCKTCKQELKEIINVYNALKEIVDKDKCPSAQLLTEYANNNCPPEQASKIKKHSEYCASCTSWISLFQASDEEIKIWEAKEEQAFKEFQKNH